MRSVPRLFVLTLLLCSFAFAQTTGNIYGKVTDSADAPLPNVKVTITSPALINAQLEVTGAAGLFQFPTLPIGVYKVTFEAAGFSTSVREGVELVAGFTADVNMAMDKGAQGTTVVTSHSQMVNQRDTNVQANVQASQLANVGASRDIWSIMAVTPGSQIVGTVDIGGNQAGSQRSTYNYGYRGGNARNQIDGVNTTENTASAGMYYDYGSVGELRQSTAGNDASMPVPGTFLNAIVKQGSDTFHGGAYIDYENPSFQGHNITDAQLEQGSGVGTRVSRYQDYNGDFAGRIIRNRLWFYVSARDQLLGGTVTGFPAENPSMPNVPVLGNEIKNLTEKITIKLRKNHRLTQFATINGKQYLYRGAAQNYWLDAIYQQNAPAYGGNLRYEGGITRRFFVAAMVTAWGYNWTNHGWPGQNCDMVPARTAVPCVDGQMAARLYENATTNNEGSFQGYYSKPRRWVADTSGKYFADHILGTNMNFTFGYMWERESLGTQSQGPLGQMYYWFNSPGKPDFSVPYQVTVENGPTNIMDIQRHQGAYVSDQIKLGKRAILTAGVRWDYYRNYAPVEHVRTDAIFRDFFYAGAPLPNGYSIPATLPDFTVPARQVLYFPQHFAPRIGLAYDLTGKANFILKMSYGRFWNNPSYGYGGSYNGIQLVGGGTSGTPSSSAPTFKWSDPNLLPFNWNQVGAFVSGGLSSTSTIAPNIRLPHIDEGTIFLERQFTKTTSVRLGYVFRRGVDDFTQIDLGRPYSMYTQWATVYDPGPDGVRGTADDRGNITVCCDIPLKPGDKLPVSQLQGTNNTTPAEYMGTDITATKRMSNHWMLQGSFSWSASHIQYAGTTSNAIPQNPLQAYNTSSHVSYWGSNYRASYQAPLGIVISPTVRLMQGQPTIRTVNMTGLNVGSYTLNVDPYGAYRYDNVYVFDTRVEKKFKFKEKYNLGLFLDVYNITNGNARVTYNTATGTRAITLSASQFPSIAGTYTYAQFGSPSAIVGPRVARLGVKLNF